MFIPPTQRPGSGSQMNSYQKMHPGAGSNHDQYSRGSAFQHYNPWQQGMPSSKGGSVGPFPYQPQFPKMDPGMSESSAMFPKGVARQDSFARDMHAQLFGQKTSYKSILPPLRPNQGPTFVNSKQVHRILKMRQKRQEKLKKLGIPISSVTNWNQPGWRPVSTTSISLMT